MRLGTENVLLGGGMSLQSQLSTGDHLGSGTGLGSAGADDSRALFCLFEGNGAKVPQYQSAGLLFNLVGLVRQ